MNDPAPFDVLVVENDPGMADVMLRVLQMAGYSASRVENGEQAIAAVARKKPSLVLLDVLMPVMDGWQCARELRARYGDSLPIVMVTAAEHVQERGKEIGADEVLPKPFEMRHLRKVVERYAVASRGAPHA